MSVIRRNATGGKSSLTVAATNTADRLKRQSIERSAQWPPAPQFQRTRQWKRPIPARGAALRIVFCGWFKAGAHRAGRQAVGPAVFPASAFHGLERTLTHVAQPAASRPSTNTRPKEMPMKQREPEEHGRPAEEPGPGALLPRFRSSGYRASIRRPKPPKTPEQRDT